jgi:hypothetical protein
MRSKLFCKHFLFSVCLLSLSLSACLPVQSGAVSTAAPTSLPPESLSTAVPSSNTPPAPMSMLEVVYVMDGSIHVWDEATQQTRILVNTGDVFSVTASDDGQVIAFTRGSWVGPLDGYEQFALWVINRDGGNPRELISALDLRSRIRTEQRYSSNFLELRWVPQTHKLIFSGTDYIVQGEGLSHAIPRGAYLVDTDDGSVTVLAGDAENPRFVPSPDGNQIALIFPTSLSFVSVDGSNKRRDVLTYGQVGLANILFPRGVWTQDSSAFVITGSLERDPRQEVNFTILRVPADGSPPEALVTAEGSDPTSVNFSPDGKSAAFLQVTDTQPAEIAGWLIKPLTPEAGPLAIPYYGKETFMDNLHWSPAGDAFAIHDQELGQLCPDATDDSQVCGEPIYLGSGKYYTALQWVDAARFLFESIEPRTLSLGTIDGTITPIVTWTEAQRWEENGVQTGWSFYFRR